MQYDGFFGCQNEYIFEYGDFIEKPMDACEFSDNWPKYYEDESFSCLKSSEFTIADYLWCDSSPECGLSHISMPKNIIPS